MTPREALTQILADGAQRNDPRWPQVKAERVRDRGGHRRIAAEWERDDGDTTLRLEVWPDGFTWAFFSFEEVHEIRAPRTDLSPTFWAHLDRMTEGM
jgi:hypothetical protein